MHTLYIYLKNGYLHIEVNKIHIRWVAPLCMKSIEKILKYSNKTGLVTVLVKNIYSNGLEDFEEDYIDVKDLLDTFEYDSKGLLSKIGSICFKEV